MKGLIKQFAVVLGAIGIGAGVHYAIKGDLKRVYICDRSLLKEHEACMEQVMADVDGVLWVDARHRKDWQQTRVKDAILWNLDKEEDMAKFVDEGAPAVNAAKKVVVYCYDEQCGVSHQVAGKIRDLQLGPEVWVLKGGWRAINDWDRYYGGGKLVERTQP